MDSLQDFSVFFWIVLLGLGGFAVGRTLMSGRFSGPAALRKRGGGNRNRTGAQIQAPSLTDPLLNACLGDAARAERLTRRELRISPGIPRHEARERAFQRILRERG